MIRHIENLGWRRAAILCCIPLLLLVPFINAAGAFWEALKAIPEATRNCRDMWSSSFKPCKRI